MFKFETVVIVGLLVLTVFLTAAAAQRDAQQGWERLTDEHKRDVERLFPGIRAWVEQPEK